MRRSLALRTRVAIAAGLGATLVAGLVSATVATALVRREYAELDQRLAAVSDVLAPVLAGAGDPTAPRRAIDTVSRQLAEALDAPYIGVAFRDGKPVASMSQDGAAPSLPQLPPGRDTIVVDGRSLLVQTRRAAGGLTISIALPRAGTEAAAGRVVQYAVLVLILAALGSAGIGWLLAGPAVRPLRTLRDRTQAIDGEGRLPPKVRLDDVRGAREAEELAGALGDLLSRVDAAHAERTQALQTARAFAASASHELRTPLTAMRTDLDVLRAHPDLSDTERGQVIADLDHAQRRVEVTLLALGQLARGDLADRSGFGPVDVAELVYAAAADTERGTGSRPPVTVHIPEADLIIPGSSAGLRLALDNLLRNAVVHGRPSRIAISVERTATEVQIVVDDDGPGVPPAERAAVFGRFVRGSTAASGGSGLGLALVAQQAALHDGTAYLLDSPLGGLRAVLGLRAG